MWPFYGAMFLISIIVCSTYKYFPKYTHSCKKVLQTMQFQVRKKFFRGIVQFFGKKGFFDGNLRLKYAAILLSKFLTSMIVLSTYKYFPKHAHSAKCSLGYSVSSQEKLFSAA